MAYAAESLKASPDSDELENCYNDDDDSDDIKDVFVHKLIDVLFSYVPAFRIALICCRPWKTESIQ